jgi:hypothetical protein
MVNQYDKIWRLAVVEYRETKLLFTFDGVLFSFRGNKFSGDLPLKKVKVYHLAFVATAVLKDSDGGMLSYNIPTCRRLFEISRKENITTSMKSLKKRIPTCVTRLYLFYDRTLLNYQEG